MSHASIFLSLALVVGLAASAGEEARKKKKPLIDAPIIEGNQLHKDFKKAIKPLSDGVNKAVDDTVDAVDQGLRKDGAPKKN